MASPSSLPAVYDRNLAVWAERHHRPVRVIYRCSLCGAVDATAQRVGGLCARCRCEEVQRQEPVRNEWGGWGRW
ncbi:MAG: hypothetical protein GF393_10625 [Armatimonadia bacterium]|nr:hypothetical protein [Armatimonadia bacterium]